MLNKLKKMNAYHKLMLIASILTILTIFKEYYHDPLYPLKPDITSNIKLNFWRWVHWFTILFMSCFLLFFNIKTLNKDLVLYYSILLIIVIHWHTDICMISLLETKNYNINPKDVNTANIPFIRSLFGDFGRDIISKFFYFLTIYTFVYVTLFTKKINKVLKYSIFIIISISFYNTKLNKTHKNYNNGFLYDCLMANPFI